MGRVWISVEKLLGLDEPLRGLALNRVGRSGKRRARESNERRLAELWPQQPDGFQDERRALPGIEGREPGQVGCGSYRWREGGAVFAEAHRLSHGLQRNEQVGEHNRRVEGKAPDGLHGHLGR